MSGQFVTTLGHFLTRHCKFDNHCIMTRTLITQAAIPLLTSVTTFRFHTNATLQPKKRKEVKLFAYPRFA